MCRTKSRAREALRRIGMDVKQIVVELKPVLRGWGNYFRTGNADRKFNKMDGYVFWRIRRWQLRLGRQRATKPHQEDHR